ncbi:uncharacterized protein VP01_3561g4 [Puccinia sorghi]|uniref:DUF659 domain-containing protein n=1 Tax=Puccinia sorghi TaxID=27349 RepID=A0A0L6UW66_9BASI|nr:uncharacterized protein VP01_3561g4 [Puccinia sorghi]
MSTQLKDMKRKPAPEPPTTAFQYPESTDIIDIDSNNLNSSNAGSKPSWVWNHLKDLSDPNFVIFQVVTKTGNKWGKKLKKGKSSSTKNLKNNVLQWIKSGDMRPKPPINSDNLKTVLVYLLANCDPPFAFVERKSFRKLFRLLNKSAMPLINSINQSTIATHTSCVFIQSKETIKSEILKKRNSISFTQDAWTAPNSTAFMGMTAHYINSDFTMHNLTVAVPHIQGKMLLSYCIQSFLPN